MSLSMRTLIGLVVLLLAIPGIARADLPAIVIEQSGLPFALSPSNFHNSPSNFANSSSNFENSESNFENSPSNFSNSSSNQGNSASGQRRIISEKREFLGYYVYGPKGRINIFNTSGKRTGYIPGGGHTRSMFSDSEWCGTLGENAGHTVIGLTQSCYQRLLLDR